VLGGYKTVHEAFREFLVEHGLEAIESLARAIRAHIRCASQRSTAEAKMLRRDKPSPPTP
jgi:hypothetical protein